MAYTVPALTTTIATNITITNASAAASTFSITLGRVPLALSQAIAANTTAYFDLKQDLNTTDTIVVTTPSPRVAAQISGMTVV